MSDRAIRIAAAAVLAALAPAGSLAADGAAARQILAAANVRRGLCLHLGCGREGSAGLTADLAAAGELLVGGLAPDDASAARSREAIRARGLLGRAVVEKLPVAPLPYVPDLANLVVIEDYAALARAGLTMEEVLRVTAPGGTVCRLEDGAWRTTVKPRPADMDDWPHPTHGPDGNRHSHDRLVGFPVGLRWQAGMPMNFTAWAAVRGWVLAGGRCYILSSTQWDNLAGRGSPHEFLVARDACNGLPLWRVDCRTVNDGKALNSHNLAPLTAGERAVYVNCDGRLTALDGATGAVLRTYATADPPARVALSGGVLVASCWKARNRPGLWGEWNLDGNAGAVCAFDAAGGADKWSIPAPARYLLLAGGRALMVFPAGTLTGETTIVAADLPGGKELWRVGEGALASAHAVQAAPAGPPKPAPRVAPKPPPKPNPLRDPNLLVEPGLLPGLPGVVKPQPPPRPARKAPRPRGIEGEVDLLCADAAVVVVSLPRDVRTVVLSAADGRKLWESQEYSGAVLVGSQLWLGKSVHDAASGEVKGALPIGIRPPRASAPCTPTTVVDSRLMVESRGCTYYDLSASTGQPEKLTYRGARGACVEGATPANGMFYTAQNRCRCTPNQVPGFLAFGPGGTPVDANAAAATRPTERGAAFPAIGNRKLAIGNSSDWPVYRHDAARSGISPCRLQTKLAVLWRTELADAPPRWLADEWRDAFSEALTPPVAAARLAVVARSDAGQLVALDAASGKVRWRAEVPGRIDSPPTLYGGLCILGCHDGWVYAFDAADGRGAWRSRAEPLPRRMAAFGHVESVWPAPGSVLAADGKVWTLAGRSSDSDGGLMLCEFDAATGRCVSAGPSGMGGHVDLLAVTAAAPAAGKAPGAGRPSKVKLLDTSWRAYGGRNRTASPGLFIQAGDSTYLCDGAQAACSRESSAPAAPGARPKRGGRATPVWRFPPAPAARPAPDAPPQPRPEIYCMVLSAETLALGGTEPAGDGKASGTVWLVAPTDGTLVAKIDLPAAPVCDGLALAGGRLLASLADGSVVSLGPAAR